MTTAPTRYTIEFMRPLSLQRDTLPAAWCYSGGHGGVVSSFAGSVGTPGAPPESRWAASLDATESMQSQFQPARRGPDTRSVHLK